MGRIIIWTINIVLIISLVLKVVENNNDKSMIVFIFFYAVIAGLNLLLWAILSLLKSKLQREMGNVLIGLAVAFIPAYLYVSTFV